MEGAPRVVPAQKSGAGTVLYKNRCLYSKIDPKKLILAAIERAEIRERTLVLCCSPALCYGIEELIQKLPARCAALLVETDSALFELARGRLSDLKPQDALSFAKNIQLVCASSVDSVTQSVSIELFKRVMRIDFSAGVSLNPQFYDDVERALSLGIARFWKNRATLMYLGRLYCRNLFLNLPRLPHSRPLPRASVDRPILVVASGLSADDALETLASRRVNRADDVTAPYYIIAVDTALPALLSRGIMPDLVTQVEAQIAIEAAFIAAGKKKISIAADIVSRQRYADYYFFSRFTTAAFIDRLRARNILPAEFPAMGSVALYAVEIALLLRAGEDIPVFVCGVDFSFIPGKTHCKGTPAHAAQLLCSNRLTPAGDVFAAFRQGSRAARDKGGGTVITDPALQGYRDLFCERFSGKQNLFDAGGRGLDLGLPRAELPARRAEASGKTGCGSRKTETPREIHTIRDFLCGEESALLELRALLSGNTPLSEDARRAKIRELLFEREYLFLHFPDGHEPSIERQFLTRVRAEIDFFLKDIKRALRPESPCPAACGGAGGV